MPQLAIGVLRRASSERRKGMVYAYSCSGCKQTLAASQASAAILKSGGIGLCEECADLMTGFFNGVDFPASLDKETADRLAGIAKMLLALKVTKGEIFSIDT